MSTWGDVVGVAGLAGSAVLDYYGLPEVGVPLASASTAELNSSIADDKVKKAEQYNSPQAQMSRFAAAGLNPDLIYNSAGGYQAPPAASSNIATPEFQTKAFYDQQKAQVDNTRQAIKTASAQRVLDLANADKSVQETSNANLDFNRMSDTYSADVTAATLRNQKTLADIDKTQADTTFTIDANQRAALMNPQTMAKTMADIAYTNQLTVNAQQQNQINSFAASMSSSGIDANSPAWLKIVTSYMSKIFPNLPIKAR